MYCRLNFSDSIEPIKKPVKYLLQILLTTLLFQGLVQAELEQISEKEPSVNVASTFTKIENKVLLGSISTRVDLEVGELTLKEGSLQGTYCVNVDASEVPIPLRFIAEGKNEEGQITLPCASSFSELMVTGGTLKGHGYCKEKEMSRIITCEVLPNENSDQSGTIKLTIDTGLRVMDFVSEYVVKGS